MEKILRVPAKEVTLFRFTCNECKSAMEVPLDRLSTATLRCSSCGKELRRTDTDRTLREFANNIQFLQNHKDFEFQFVLTAEDRLTFKES